MSRDGYPTENGGWCDWCGEPLRELNHMINPLELLGRLEYVCGDCVGDFMEMVANVGYSQACVHFRDKMSPPIDKLSHVR